MSAAKDVSISKHEEQSGSVPCGRSQLAANCEEAFNALADSNKLKTLPRNSQLLVYSAALIYIKQENAGDEAALHLRQHFEKARALVKVARTFSEALETLGDDEALRFLKAELPILRLSTLLQAGAKSVADDIDNLLNKAFKPGKERAFFDALPLGLADAEISKCLQSRADGDFAEFVASVCYHQKPSDVPDLTAEAITKRRLRSKREYPERTTYLKEGP